MTSKQSFEVDARRTSIAEKIAEGDLVGVPIPIANYLLRSLPADVGLIPAPGFARTRGVPKWAQHPPDAEGQWVAWRIPEETEQLTQETAGALDHFLQLAAATSTDDQTLAFVRRWGSLQLCHHLKPASHDPRCSPMGFDLETYPGGPSGPFDALEPAWAIRQFARQFRVLFDRTFAIHERRSESGETDQRFEQAILNELRELVTMSNYRLMPSWVAGEIRQLAEGDTFGVLVAQLVAALAGGQFSTCTNCRRVYAPRRKPRAGDRTYCHACRGARQKDYQRRRRRPPNREAARR